MDHDCIAAVQPRQQSETPIQQKQNEKPKGKYVNTWKLNNMFLNDHWVNKEDGNKKILGTNYGKNISKPVEFNKNRAKRKVDINTCLCQKSGNVTN